MTSTSRQSDRSVGTGVNSLRCDRAGILLSWVHGGGMIQGSEGCRKGQSQILTTRSLLPPSHPQLPCSRALHRLCLEALRQLTEASGTICLLRGLQEVEVRIFRA